MVETIHRNWLDYFLHELKKSSSVYIISPFISGNIVRQLLMWRGDAEIKLITRFNLNDFRSGVSSLRALSELVESGVKIKGIKSLHSKVYTFDERSTIIGSANFTSGGFFNNYEFGIKSDESETIVKSIEYFQNLWQLDSEILTRNQIESWETEIKNSKPSSAKNDLPDYGKSASLQGSKPKRFFVKFFGKAEYRVGLDYSSTEEIERSHCHWALTFSGRRGRYGNGRPRKYQDGDVVYMARMLEGNDYGIFGKGYVLRHVDDRDVASSEDIKNIPWKSEWPVYIRVYDTCFINGKMENCPKLSDLMSELQFDSFPTTQNYYREGRKNINPRASLKQKADIQLTDIAAEWLENEFQNVINQFGTVPDDFINNLYPGSPTIKEILK